MGGEKFFQNGAVRKDKVRKNRQFKLNKARWFNGGFSKVFGKRRKENSEQSEANKLEKAKKSKQKTKLFRAFSSFRNTTTVDEKSTANSGDATNFVSILDQLQDLKDQGDTHFTNSQEVTNFISSNLRNLLPSNGFGKHASSDDDDQCDEIIAVADVNEQKDVSCLNDGGDCSEPDCSAFAAHYDSNNESEEFNTADSGGTGGSATVYLSGGSSLSQSIGTSSSVTVNAEDSSNNVSSVGDLDLTSSSESSLSSGDSILYVSPSNRKSNSWNEVALPEEDEDLLTYLYHRVPSEVYEAVLNDLLNSRKLLKASKPKLTRCMSMSLSLSSTATRGLPRNLEAKDKMALRDLKTRLNPLVYEALEEALVKASRSDFVTSRQPSSDSQRQKDVVQLLQDRLKLTQDQKLIGRSRSLNGLNNVGMNTPATYVKMEVII